MSRKSPFGPHAFSPSELAAQFEADRDGLPYLVLRDDEETMRLFALPHERRRLTIGRSATCDIALPWDERVSRVHAELLCVGDAWAVVDDGLSRNGTFVGAERLAGRKRLEDGDVIRTGSTSLLFRAPLQGTGITAEGEDPRGEVTLTEAQRRVLISLCRPYSEGNAGALPASNREIADDLVLSISAVKTHLRTLFDKLAVEDLPHNRKRARLVELAFEHGLVGPRDLG